MLPEVVDAMQRKRIRHRVFGEPVPLCNEHDPRILEATVYSQQRLGSGEESECGP